MLTGTTFLERFTEIPKNLLANQDAYVWINMLFHIGQRIRDKSVAKISSDESCQYSYASFKAKYFVFMDSYWKIQKTKLITRW